MFGCGALSGFVGDKVSAAGVYSTIVNLLAPPPA